MIARLVGYFTDFVGKDYLIQTASGVGYIVSMVTEEYTLGHSIACYTYENVNQDGSRYLYGFESLNDRELFSLLLRAPGVGPKSAASLLRTYGASELANLIVFDGPFTTKGVGVKGVASIRKLKKPCAELLDKWKRDA